MQYSVYIIDQVQKAIEDRDYSYGIFQDSKAFDTVNHNIMLTKLAMNIMVSEVLLKTGLTHISATELKRYLMVPLFLTCKQFFVGCLKDQF